jgi:hypothetical protein
MGRKNGVSFHRKKRLGKFCFIVILCCRFESSKRRGKELGGSERKTRRKTLRGSEKNQTILCWKEEGKASLALQKETKM